MPPDHRFSPEMRARFITFYKGWMSEDGQEYLRANLDSFRAIAKFIQENRSFLEQWCANELTTSSEGELTYDTVAELICLEDGMRIDGSLNP